MYLITLTYIPNDLKIILKVGNQLYNEITLYLVVKK